MWEPEDKRQGVEKKELCMCAALMIVEFPFLEVLEISLWQSAQLSEFLGIL